MTRPVLLALSLSLSACPAPGETCATTADCGDLQACVRGACREVDCRANADCPLENRCDLEAFTCIPGCTTSEDCLVGERCDGRTDTCVPRSCVDTQLDCSPGERCNRSTGQCEPDTSPHCSPCLSSEECGPNGYCSGTRVGVCFISCSPESVDPCPAGLQCSAQVDANNVPIGFLCVGSCEGF